MVEKGFMWDSVSGDRQYGSQDMADAFGGIVSDGVVDADNDFLITLIDSNNAVVRIASGAAWIGGRMLKLDGFEDITLPYSSWNMIGPYDGILVLKCRPDAAYRDFAFIAKYPAAHGDPTPQIEDGEILIARFKYERGFEWLSEDDIQREVTKANAINNKVDIATDTDINGLLKGKDGKVAQAVPGQDYLPTWGGTIIGPLIPQSGMVNGQIQPYPFLGTPDSPFQSVYADEAHFTNSATVGGKDVATIVTGTWTPIIYGDTTAGTPTYATQWGRFDRIGNTIVCTFNVRLSAIGGISGRVYMRGLPLPLSSTYPAIYDCEIPLMFAGMTGLTNCIGMTARLFANGGLYAGLQTIINSSGNVTLGNLAASNLTTATEFKGCLIYRVD